VLKDEEGEGEDEDENEELPAPAKPLKRKAEVAEKVLMMEEFLAKRAEFFLAKAKVRITLAT
jgi:hypothetical protein